MVSRLKFSDRWPAFLFFTLFGGGGLLLLWMALTGLLGPVLGVQARSTVVAFRPSDAIALGPALSLFAFAAMTLLPDNRLIVGKKRRATAPKPRVDAATTLLAIAFIGIAASFVAAPVSQFAFGGFAQGLGYMHCPPPKVWDRHAPLRWALASKACP